MPTRLTRLAGAALLLGGWVNVLFLFAADGHIVGAAFMRTGQFAVIDAKGQTAVFTGPKASEWAGHKQGKFCTAQGNILAGPAVVEKMVEAYEQTEGHLSLRLLAALEAGQAAGGDTRGMQSAAMVVVKKGGGVWLNNDVVLRLQVDDNPEPIKELRRLVEISARQRAPRRRP